MAMNPMQRKANMYLIIGVLVTLVITGSIIAFLFVQLNNLQTAKKEEEAKLKKIYVLAQDVNSGEKLTPDMFSQQTISSKMIPGNAITMDMLIDTTIEENKDKAPTIAKINLLSGTIVTSDMIVESDNKLTDDVRLQEYNMVVLPSQIQTGEYIDIRLRMQTGEDFIIVSKKQVEIPAVEGIDSETSIWINMSEADTLVMSNAIVEAYTATGSYLYAAKYVEPGNQNAATATYVPKAEIQQLIYSDPNIVQEAKAALITRYNGNTAIRNSINNALSPYNEDAQKNIESKVQDEMKKAAEERQKYLESLGM